MINFGVCEWFDNNIYVFMVSYNDYMGAHQIEIDQHISGRTC